MCISGFSAQHTQVASGGAPDLTSPEPPAYPLTHVPNRGHLGRGRTTILESLFLHITLFEPMLLDAGGFGVKAVY